MIISDLRRQSTAPDDATPEGEPARADDVPGRRDPGRDACGLRFSRPGGPIVVICGLHGGAGTSTLAYVLAAQAAHESPATVLLCETDAAGGDLATLAGVSSPYSLSELAAEFEAGRAPPGGALARAGRLRVIAAPPAPAPAVDDGSVVALINAARRRHGLTVIDAGTPRDPLTREVLRIATHVIWVTVARPGSAQRGRALLASRLAPAIAGRQALVVRGLRRKGRTGTRQQAVELRQLANDCCERLVLIVDSPGVSGTHIELSERRMRSALTSLAGFLADSGGG